MPSDPGRRPSVPERRPAIRIVAAGDDADAGGLAALGPASDGRIEVVATAADGPSTLSALGAHRPDLVILALREPAPEVATSVAGIRADHPAVRVVVLAEADDTAGATAALGAGADAVIPFASRPEQLLAPVLAVLQGWKVLHRGTLDDLVRRSGRPGSEVLTDLDAEQLRLWRMVAEGMEVSSIAAELFVSERTAKRLVADLRQRLGARSRIDMAVMAGRVGLLDDLDGG